MPDPRPWERQPGETSRSFGYFTLYRDLGPGRSVRQAAEEAAKRHQSEGRPGRPPRPAALEHLSKPPHPVPYRGRTRLRGQDWIRRAAAWDAEQDRIRRLKRTLDFLQEDKDEGVALNAAFGKALAAVSSATVDQLKGKDAFDVLLEVVRLRRLRRGQATDLVGEVPAAPLAMEEDDDVVARALAADPELLDRWEDAVARGALARVPPDARGPDQPGTVDPLPLPAGGGPQPPPDGGAGDGGDPGRPAPPAAR